jgi:polar amino acid transport system permease protein
LTNQAISVGLTDRPPEDVRLSALPSELRVVKRRHPWRQISAVIALALFGGMIWSLAHNPNIGVDEIRRYLTAPIILRGILVTLFLTAFAMVLGVLGGVVIAVMRLSENKVLSSFARLYIWAFRGIPLLVQLIFWAYAGAIYPTIALSVPFTDIVLWSAKTSDLINPMIAALLALTLNEVAYAAEIIRAGIISVDHGQSEAAYSLGMGPGRTMRRIVLPQAMRTIIPAVRIL